MKPKIIIDVIFYFIIGINYKLCICMVEAIFEDNVSSVKYVEELFVTNGLKLILLYNNLMTLMNKKQIKRRLFTEKNSFCIISSP